jgi:hypothetical protein
MDVPSDSEGSGGDMFEREPFSRGRSGWVQDEGGGESSR